MEVSEDSSEEFAKCPHCGGYVETASKGGPPELLESGPSISSGTHICSSGVFSE